MTKERNALKAGLFIIVSSFLIVVSVVLIRGEGTGATQIRTVTFSLSDDLSGLSVGDDVRIGGTKVGTVRDIQFEHLDSDKARVLVKFSIPAMYVLHEDAKIGVQAALTGPPDLNITSLGSGPTLSEGKLLSGMPDPKAAIISTLQRAAPHIENIVSNISTQTIPKLNATVDSANKLVKDVDDKIDPIVKRYEEVAGSAGAVMGNIKEVLGDTKTDLRETIKNLNVAIAAVKAKLPGLLEKVDTTLADVKPILADIKAATADTREVTAAAKTLIVENRTRLDTMIKSLKTTSDNLKATSVEVRHSPWRLLYKPSADEMGNMNLYDSARQFADGAASLTDAASALRDAMKDSKVDKDQLQKLLDHLNESFKNFHQAETKLWTSVKQ